MPQTRIHIASILNKWDAASGHSPLSEFAKTAYPQLNKKVIEYIDEHCFHYHIKKGAHLLREGENCEYLFLIIKGAFRGYVKQDGKELTTWITVENEMITSIRNLYTPEEPSIENIQAIENSDLIGASFESLQYLYDNYVDMNIVGRKLLEQYCIDAEDRSYTGRLTNVNSKYEYFLATKGHLMNRIPLKYIASYLGMTLETLSRIRSKKTH